MPPKKQRKRYPRKEKDHEQRPPVAAEGSDAGSGSRASRDPVDRNDGDSVAKRRRKNNWHKRGNRGGKGGNTPRQGEFVVVAGGTTAAPADDKMAREGSGHGGSGGGGGAGRRATKGVVINQCVRCTDDTNRVQVRSLHDILVQGEAGIDTEACTPVLGPSNVPGSVIGQLCARIPVPGRPDGVQQPQFSLDAITTPNTLRAMTHHPPPPPLLEGMHQDTFHFLLNSYDRPTDSFEWYKTADGRSDFLSRTYALIAAITPVLKNQPAIVRVSSPAYVFGDIHGNFSDVHFFLKKLLILDDITITPANILCLGDYVDRGPHSLECVVLLLALKCEAPDKVFLLRGNHEDRVVCGDRKTYGAESFLAQCIDVLGSVEGMKLFRALTRLFRWFPLAAELMLMRSHGKILCTHGGIPRFSANPLDDDKLAFLRSPNFPRLLTLFPNNPLAADDSGSEEEKKGPGYDERMQKAWFTMFDLMWSDPTTEDENVDEWGFGRNARGDTVVSFSAKAVDTFMNAHGYEMLFRAHQEKAHGIRLSKSSKVLTVFTSSNYLGHGNGAGCVIVSPQGDVQLIIKS